MRRRSCWNRRCGTTTVESAFILSVYLILVLGMIDLGIAVFRSHLIAEGARYGARQAIVRGDLASGLGPWGPDTVGPIPLTDSHPLAQALLSHLSALGPAPATVTAEWLDGSNQRGKRVRVTVTTQSTPILTSLFGINPIPLTSASTMHICH